MARKRVFEVVNNNPNKKGVRVGSRDYRFGKNGVFTVQDPDVGREIRDNHDLDTVVNEVEMSTQTEPGHNYTFSGFRIPEEYGGYKRVKVKTADGHTYVSEAVAIEEGLEIIHSEKKRSKTRRLKRREAQGE